MTEKKKASAKVTIQEIAFEDAKHLRCRPTREPTELEIRAMVMYSETGCVPMEYLESFGDPMQVRCVVGRRLGPIMGQADRA